MVQDLNENGGGVCGGGGGAMKCQRELSVKITEGVSKGVSSEGVSKDTSEGVSSKVVSSKGVSSEGVSSEGVSSEGVSYPPKAQVNPVQPVPLYAQYSDPIIDTDSACFGEGLVGLG